MDTMYEIGSIVRMQLAPNGVDFRYSQVDDQVIDEGYSGVWVDGHITEHDEENLRVRIDYEDMQGKDQWILLPIEGNRFWDEFRNLPGYPAPPRDKIKIRSCGCGSDTTYGDNNSLHEDYCPKKQDLDVYGALL